MGEPGPVSAIVLAGGRSTRFGADKLAADVDGVPLLQRALAAVATVSDEVLVVAPLTGLAAALPTANGVPVRVIRDTEAYPGPLAALAAAALAAEHERLLLVGGDMPELQEAVLRRLLRWASGRQGACLVAGGWDRPLPLALEREAGTTRAAELLQAGQRSLRAIVDHLDLERVPEAEWRALDPAARTLRDIDRPGDVA